MSFADSMMQSKDTEQMVSCKESKADISDASIPVVSSHSLDQILKDQEQDDSATSK